MNKTLKNSLALAEKLQNKVFHHPLDQHAAFKQKIEALMESPQSKTFLIQLLDRGFRAKQTQITANVIRKILNRHTSKVKLFTKQERLLVDLFRFIGYHFSALTVPMVLKKIRMLTADVVRSAEPAAVAQHIKTEKKKNIRLNTNLIGETLLGEQEALQRIKCYEDLLDNQAVDYISIKVSTIYSQLHSISLEHTVDKLTERLTLLYSYALKTSSEQNKEKFINLDMEEYRDLELTVKTFKQTLDLPQFKNYKAGIVLQAYLPDSFAYLIDLQKWANQRVNNGGAPIKIRIVKGANREMELVEASVFDWEVTTFRSKKDTDSNFKKMLLQALNNQTCSSVEIGIASHNVFDLAFAMELIKEQDIKEQVTIEMLEGMAIELCTAIQEEGFQLLLYSPIVFQKDFTNAVAYLVRRLDESTSKGNFLREGFKLKPNTPKWKDEADKFTLAFDEIDKIRTTPFRQQNRTTEKAILTSLEWEFKNEANTDWTLPQNRSWLNDIKTKWEKPSNQLPETTLLSGVNGTINEPRETKKIKTWQGQLPWEFALATADDYNKTLTHQRTTWSLTNFETRFDTLLKVAQELRAKRADLIGVAITELGKTATELDAEISEAIDFAEYYPRKAKELYDNKDLVIEGQGVNLVISPWNFPIAIPAGGLLASLASGNYAVLKPASNAVATASMLCQCFYDAGVPKDVLQFLPCESATLKPILEENKFASVILTGGTSTAQSLLENNPYLNLSAETGGKNATIVSAKADKELAIKHIIQSAFSNSGQKCSATSLLILEKEVYDDERFKAQLKDAVQSQLIGSPWEFHHTIGPLAQPTAGNLKKSLALENKQEWLVKPQLDETAYFLHPSVKYGVEVEDFDQENELFGPALSVVRADNLQHAIIIANQSAYGLTSGIESLDENEIEFWLSQIQAGNLYINKPTTGAIVGRQPFGGIKASSFGKGLKAGGSNYISQFLTITVKPKKTELNPKVVLLAKIFYSLTNDQLQLLSQAYDDACWQWKHYFSKQHEEITIRGEDNILRYIAADTVIQIINPHDTLMNILMRLLTSSCLPSKLEVLVTNHQEHLSYEQIKALKNHFGFKLAHFSSWLELEEKLQPNTRIRVEKKEDIPKLFMTRAHKKAIHIYTGAPLANTRLEFLNYMQEQAISHAYHRYGNLMGRTVDN